MSTLQYSLDIILKKQYSNAYYIDCILAGIIDSKPIIKSKIRTKTNIKSYEG